MRRLWLIAPLALVLGACGGSTVVGGSGGASSTGSTSSSSSSGSGGSSNADCESGGDSNLPNVSIDFPDQRCTFTLAEAAEGISIAYQVIVGEPAPSVVPRAQDAGQCDQPGDSGLILFEQIGGDGQSYCRCDQGLCAPPPNDEVQLTPGTFEHSFDWNGVNWSGPSDTGNPPGPPFPAGSYTFTVSARGIQDVQNSTGFEVTGTFEVILVP